MNIIIFGPQGCGKGTQADLIARKYGLYHLSMGDELRKEVKSGSALGKNISAIINAGILVPDEIADKLLMNVAKTNKSIIFDGYPRRDTQLAFLMKNFKIDAAIELSLSEKESIKRIASRRTCPKCGRNYNIIYIKPKVDGRCDADNAELVQRIDDMPAEIKKRLAIYREQTEPLKKYYSKKRILHVINGNQSIADVAQDVEKVLKLTSSK